MVVLSRICAMALIVAALGGCQSIGSVMGGGGSVMPDSDVGPPPSMRGSVSGRRSQTSSVDEDGRAVPVNPTRRLDIPRSMGGATRSADAGERRIRREEIEGGNATSGGSTGMAPTLTGSGMGMGSKF